MSNTLKFGNGEWYGKEGTILAYNDENNNYKPLPFNFDRDSVATRVNKQGLIETVGADQPRIDYLNDSNGALLLEPSRTNSIAYSNDLNASGWNTFSADGGTVIRTSNYGISPSGKQDSTRVVFTTEFVSLYYSFSGISGDASATMYVKGVEGEVIAFGFGSDVSFGQEFTLNGQWQRIEFNATSTNTTLNITAWGSTRDASDIEVYGVQIEAGSYATSYIPTQGSAVTRLADSCNNGGNEQVINSTEGVLYAEISALADDGTGRNLGISDGTTSNRILILYSNNSNQLRFYLAGSGGSITVNHTLTEVTEFIKVAIKYKTQDFSFYVNGVEVNTNSSNITFSGLDDLSFNNPFGGGTSNFYGNVKDVRVYNTALTDQELAALTQV